jgi:hypothetical protein
MVAGVRGTRSTDEAHRVLGLQQVYACLLSEGPIELAGPVEPPADDHVKAVFSLVETVRRLSDVLREITSTTVATIGECKNVDFTFFKDLGPDQMRETIRHA